MLWDNKPKDQSSSCSTRNLFYTPKIKTNFQSSKKMLNEMKSEFRENLKMIEINERNKTFTKSSLSELLENLKNEKKTNDTNFINFCDVNMNKGKSRISKINYFSQINYIF